MIGFRLVLVMLGRVQGSGALFWTGCLANSEAECFNNSYIEGKKNRVRLKL